MEEQEPYEIPISPILAEIDKQNWTDLASINASFPKNEFFEVLPPPECTPLRNQTPYTTNTSG